MPADLKYFKATTLGKPVIMGRKTFESLGRPLPGRLNIVLSNNKDLELPEGVMLFHHMQEALGYLQHREAELNADEVFIIGGGQIFQMSLPIADKVYLTKVHTTCEGADAHFPALDHTEWLLKWSEPHNADEKNIYDFEFQRFEKIKL